MLRKAVADGHTWYHLLSGMDYPISSREERDRFFATTGWKAFLSFVHESQLADIEEHRLNRYHLNDVLNLRTSILGKIASRLLSRSQQAARSMGIRLRPALGIKVWKGANWFSIHHDVAQYTLGYLDAHPAYDRRFRYTSCCDEVYFHTLLMQSPFAPAICHDDLRYIRWQGNASPEWLDESDFTPMMQSANLFCRKIHPEISRELVARIDRKISKHTLQT